MAQQDVLIQVKVSTDLEARHVQKLSLIHI